VLRIIFGPKNREVVATGWFTLHNEELRNLYASPDIVSVIKSRRMRWAGHVARMEVMTNVYIILVGKRERPRRRWGGNIITDLREIQCHAVDWVCQGQDRDEWRALVNTVINMSSS
jgi:hypothetical protein